MSLLDTCDLLIFDCDGVLVDSERLAVEAFVAVLNEAGVDATVPMVEACFGMKQADTLLRVSEETGQDIPEDAPGRIWPATRDAFRKGLKAMPGVEDVLRATGGTKRCVASSSSPERIAESLAITNLAGFFGDRVFSSHQVARGKPAPDLFLFAATSIGVEPARCVVIEDSLFGVEGALAAGMTAIGFAGGSHIPEGHAASMAQAGARHVERRWADVLARLTA